MDKSCPFPDDLSFGVVLTRIHIVRNHFRPKMKFWDLNLDLENRMGLIATKTYHLRKSNSGVYRTITFYGGGKSKSWKSNRSYWNQPPGIMKKNMMLVTWADHGVCFVQQVGFHEATLHRLLSGRWQSKLHQSRDQHYGYHKTKSLSCLLFDQRDTTNVNICPNNLRFLRFQLLGLAIEFFIPHIFPTFSIRKRLTFTASLGMTTKTPFPDMLDAKASTSTILIIN